MPLTVPWIFYFLFLGAVLIPFVVMIALAWRKRPDDDSPSKSSGPPPLQPRSGG